MKRGVKSGHNRLHIFLTSHNEKAFVEKVKSITNYGYIIKNSGEFVLVESITMAFTLFEENYRLIFNAVNDAIVFQDLQTGEVLDVNPKALEMYGYEVYEMHLSKIEKDEYLVLFRDMVESPSIWADIGILQKNGN